MTEVNYIEDIEIFRNALVDDNVLVQIDAVRKLAALSTAVGPTRTREELIPCVSECVEFLHDEILYNLAEQLERFVPLVGGKQHLSTLLDLLVKLSNVDENLVRNRAVETIKSISRHLSNQECEQIFFPLIQELANNEWFTSKCSAAPLFAVCYPKMSTEKQKQLIAMFKVLIQDESPIVRRAAENGLVDFVDVLDLPHLKSDFVPIFDNLATDDQDSVRTLAIDVGIAMAKHLDDLTIGDYHLLTALKNLSVDTSWKVRQRIALRIHEIQEVASDKNREIVLFMYQSCVRDIETEVRTVAAKNLFAYCLSLKNAFKKQSEQNFEKMFQDDIMPQIHRLVTDESDEVRLALSESILSLTTILRDECFKRHILPLILDALENEESMAFKENVLKNLNSLPMDVDISKSFKSIDKVIRNLLSHSDLHWRTRRNIVIALLHIAKKSSVEFFDNHLKDFYIQLLADPVFAIRRTAPLILPFLVKQYGTDWAKISLLPTILLFAEDHRYLFRYVVLYCVKELVCPRLNAPRADAKNRNNMKYLHDFRQLATSDANNIFTKTLLKIVDLNKVLLDKIGSISEKEYTNDLAIYDDKIELYAEDTLETLKASQNSNVFVIKREDIKSNHTCYLEGLLSFLITDFLDAMKLLLKDTIYSVRVLSTNTLKLVKVFSQDIEKEKNWLDEELKFLPKKLDGKSTDDLHKQLEKCAVKTEEQEVVLNLELATKEDAAGGSSKKAAEIKEPKEETEKETKPATTDSTTN